MRNGHIATIESSSVRITVVAASCNPQAALEAERTRISLDSKFCFVAGDARRLKVPFSDLHVEGHCGNVVEEHEADRLHFRMTLQ